MNSTEQGRAKRPTVSQRLASGELDERRALELTREAALRTLDCAAKSRSDLTAGLVRRGYPEQLVEAVLDRLTEVGLIDDGAYAQALVRAGQAERGLSKLALSRELTRRGISPDAAAQALKQVNADTEEAAMQAVIAKSLRRTIGLDKQTRLRRTVSALSRKGYQPGQGYAAVLGALADQADDDFSDSLRYEYA